MDNSPDAPSHLLPLVDGAYRTKPRRISLIARAFPSVVFFTKFFLIVCRSARLAKRGGYDSLAWAVSSRDTLEALESVGCQFEITGIDHLRGFDGPCVVVGNHMSTLETAVLPVVIQPVREVTFVVKQSLIDYPIFKHVMRSRNPIAISQTNPREDLKAMLVGGAERLERGVSVVVFPEGERRMSFDPVIFNTIGVKLAGRTESPIVPVALDTRAWGLGRPIPDLGRIDPRKKIRIAFGEPIAVHGRGTGEHHAVVAFIKQRLEEWQAIDATSAATAWPPSGRSSVLPL